MKQEVAKWNSRFYSGALLPLYEVVGKGEPPKSLDAWKGMRIRALGQQGKAMAKLGAVPTSVPAPDVYTYLSGNSQPAASMSAATVSSASPWRNTSRGTVAFSEKSKP